jgi:hypothetical protein
MRRQRGATRAPSGAARRQPPLYDYILSSPLSHTFLRGTARFRTRRRRGARTRLIAQGGRRGNNQPMRSWGGAVGAVRVEEAAAEASAGKRGRGGGSGDENHACPPSPEYSIRSPAQFIHILGLILSPCELYWPVTVTSQRFLYPKKINESSSPSPNFLEPGPRYPARVRVQLAARTPLRFPLPLSSSSSPPSQFPTKPEEPSRPCRELKPPDARPPPAPAAAEILARECEEPFNLAGSSVSSLVFA